MKKATIIITAYNVEQFIDKAMDSALRQIVPEGWELEIVVVNDASTDSTPTLLDFYRRDPRVRIFTQSENKGAGVSRRNGILIAKGEYILLLDGDDWLQPGFMNALITAAEKYDADVVSGGVTVLTNERTGAYDVKTYGNIIAKGHHQITDFMREGIMFMNNKLIRRSLFDKHPYSERRYIEDTPSIVPILYYANMTVYVNHPGYIYRMRQGSLTHTTSSFKSVLFRALCVKDLYLFFEDKPKEYRDIFSKAKVVEVYNEYRRTQMQDGEYKQWEAEIEELEESITKILHQ